MRRSLMLRVSEIVELVRREFSLLALVCMGSTALLCFVLLASEVREGETHAFDEWVLLALRTPSDASDPIGPRWLEAMLLDITSLGSTTVIILVTALAFGYSLLRHRVCEAVVILAAIGSGAILSTALKAIVARPRPELISHLVDVQTLSFPSGHATSSAVTYLTLGTLLLREENSRSVRIYVMAAACVIILMIGASRIYLGVHWPTDVLAGWSIGAAWAMLWLASAWRLCPRGI